MSHWLDRRHSGQFSLNQTLSEVSGEGLWVDNDDGTQDFVVEDSASNNTIVIAEDMTEGEVDDFMEEMMTAQEAGDYCPCPGTQDGHAGFYISPDGMVQYFSQKDFNAIFNEMGSDEEGGEEDEDALSKDDGDAAEQDAVGAPCIWDRPITYELQVELLLVLQRLAEHFTAAAVSIT